MCIHSQSKFEQALAAQRYTISMHLMSLMFYTEPEIMHSAVSSTIQYKLNCYVHNLKSIGDSMIADQGSLFV